MEKDPLIMIKNDHDKVKMLFADFVQAKTGDSKDKPEIVKKIFDELEKHMEMEEESFYPAVAKVGGNEMVMEAMEEHALAKKLRDEIKDLDPDDMLYNAKMEVMRETIEHHIQKEESRIFPFVRENMLSQMPDMAEEMTKSKGIAEKIKEII